MRNPFTDKERKIMDLLVEAHNEFTLLDKTHTSEISEWLINFHNLQRILSSRVLRRDYPETFTSI
jgi:hypothetical protein